VATLENPSKRRLTAQCSRRAAVCWTGAEAPILHLCDGVTAVADRFCQSIVRRGNCRAASLRGARWPRAADWSVR
jgi:hypothetical protein